MASGRRVSAPGPAGGAPSAAPPAGADRAIALEQLHGDWVQWLLLAPSSLGVTFTEFLVDQGWRRTS